MSSNIIVGAVFLIIVAIIGRKVKKMFGGNSSSSSSSNNPRNWSCTGCGQIIQQKSRPSNDGKCGSSGKRHQWTEL